MKLKILAAAFAAMVLTSMPAGAQTPNGGGGEVRQLFRQPLPEKRGMDMVVITVTYPPGGSTPPHEHPGFTYAYVLKGAVTSALGGGPPKTYTEGESWSEKPFQHHTVSKNASNTEEAKLLVFFVVPHNAKLVIPIGSH